MYCKEMWDYHFDKKTFDTKRSRQYYESLLMGTLSEIKAWMGNFVLIISLSYPQTLLDSQLLKLESM